MSTAIQITLGAGRVLVSHFTDEDGGRGLVFQQTDEDHPIGSSEGSSGEVLHEPEDGEVYLKCTNLESALVLQAMINEMCDRMTAPPALAGNESEER